MDREQRRRIAIDARMEGQHAIVSNIGGRVLLSEMELIALATFAEIGVMSVFAGMSGPESEEAAASLERTLDAVRREFEADGQDGLTRLISAAAATLRSEKVAKYVVG